MSWWIYLERNGEPVDVDPFSEGGTRTLGGSTTAELNVTYNYGGVLTSKRLHATEDLHARRAGELISRMSIAVELLGLTPDEDYWKPTFGNVGRCINRLHSWAVRYPDAVWRVS